MKSELEHAAQYFVAAFNAEMERALSAVQRDIDELKTLVKQNDPTPSAGEDRYLNQRQAAELLGCSTAFIRRMCKAGEFPEPTRLSPRDLRWSRRELLAWAKERRPED